MTVELVRVLQYLQGENLKQAELQYPVYVLLEPHCLSYGAGSEQKRYGTGEIC